MNIHSPEPPPAAWRNVLEPTALLRAFMAHPPEGFASGISRRGVPWFEAPLDLLTTADEGLRRRVRALAGYRMFGGWLRWRTLFVGTTVSEYLPLAPGVSGEVLLDDLRHGRLGGPPAHRLVVVKDIPVDSALLGAAELDAARSLVRTLRQAGFVLLHGQALAWVPTDFASLDEYLARLSYGRRKNIRRKLRSRALLDIECLHTGAPWLSDAGVRRELYALYLQVYAQSETQFDRLAPAFFDAVLQDADNAGRLFVYREKHRIVGWNLCFEFGDMLVDKYIGLDYARSRQLNLYVVSWMTNLEYARSRGLQRFVAGWTDPRIKAELGARFTFTQHAVYPRNALLRWLLRHLASVFEADRRWYEKHGQVTAGA